MQVKVFKTPEAVDHYVGDIIIDYINHHQQPVIGFATGSTPMGIYQYLIDQYQQKKVDFAHVKAFNLDEYVGLSQGHPRSFASAMRTSLFSHINISSHHIYAFDGAAKDMEKECERYNQLIKNHRIDIQLLGIGMDGHIAYNEPGSAFESECHVVDLHQESIDSSLDYGFTDLADVPRQGVTQGIHTIMQAKQLIMVAKGKKKAELVKRMIEGEISEEFPSSIIQRHSHVLVVLDQEAAQCLQEGEGDERN